MATGRNDPPPSAFMHDPQLQATYRSYQSRRPQLFRQSDSLVGMAPNTKVRISIIADGQEQDVKLSRTLRDGVLQRSLISRGKAFASRGPVQSTTTATTLVDHAGRTHTSTSTISLRWYYENGLQTYRETFHIVDKLPRPDSEGGGEWDAILRAGTEPSPEQSPPQAFPYMSVPTGQDRGKAEEQKRQAAISQKRYEAEKEAQRKQVQDRLTKNLKQGTKR